MANKFRRIITAEDGEGKSYVLSSAEPEFQSDIPNMGKMCNLWQTETVPASIPIVEDIDLSGPPSLRPGPQGTNFRLVVIEPESRVTEADKAKMIAMMEAEEDLTPGDTSADPMMHASDTLDYLVVLSGELYMLLDKEEIRVGPGDFVVQGGVNHSWSNRSDEPAVMIGATVSAERSGTAATIFRDHW